MKSLFYNLLRLEASKPVEALLSFVFGSVRSSERFLLVSYLIIIFQFEIIITSSHITTLNIRINL